jgi:hypothetical protein
MLTINPETVCYIVVKAREFHAKIEPVDTDPGSNSTDDSFREILEDFADDPTQAELNEVLSGLNEDEINDLLALMWIGRGDFTKDEWDEAIDQAAGTNFTHAPAYLIGTPMVADYLEEGLAELGYSCTDFEMGHL